jgi:hypothetical protein
MPRISLCKLTQIESKKQRQKFFKKIIEQNQRGAAWILLGEMMQGGWEDDCK